VNRRNFLLGVGTAATLSGAASVAGAALSNSVGVGFGGIQVVATNELVVRRNETLVEENVLQSNSNFTDDPINFTKIGQDGPVNYADFPDLFVNNGTNGNLTIQLATGDDHTSPYNTNLSDGGAEPYNGTQSGGYAPLVIENTGTQTKDVALEYTYGSGVGGTLSKGQVAELYNFHIDTTQVSPLSNSPDSEGNAVSIGAGQTKPVNLNLNLTEATAQDIQTVAGDALGPYDFNQASRERADILDTATFGTK